MIVVGAALAVVVVALRVCGWGRFLIVVMLVFLGKRHIVTVHAAKANVEAKAQNIKISIFVVL